MKSESGLLPEKKPPCFLHEKKAEFPVVQNVGFFA
jgi:hypothetical protein